MFINANVIMEEIDNGQENSPDTEHPTNPSAYGRANQTGPPTP